VTRNIVNNYGGGGNMDLIKSMAYEEWRCPEDGEMASKASDEFKNKHGYG
jgi:hypothetical protein